MFTGIIQNLAVLREKRDFRNGSQLTFELLGKGSSFHLGESVAVDGVCVTVSSFQGRRFSASLLPETLHATTLGRLAIGQKVNWERALRVGDSLGGHWVTGHVDGVGFIRKIERLGESHQLKIEPPASTTQLLVRKGSIAVDGISFTLQGVEPRVFILEVTPHTYRATTLGEKRVGGSVNLEIDLFAKLVQHFLSGRRTATFAEKELIKQGF